MTATLTTELRTIRVYGTLADLLGRRTFRAAVATVYDAVSFLIANFPQVEAHIRERYFRVKISTWTLGENDLSAPVGQTDEIHIIPAICGAGGNNALFGILAGIALIGASLLFPFGGPILLNLGIGLLLTGISSLISPTPEIPDDDNDPSKSYNFSGVQQTSREGVPVPLVYGDIITGSIVISAGFDEYDEEIEFGFIEGEGDPNPAGDGELFQQVYSVDYCAQHLYRWEIEACITYSFTTVGGCGSGYINSCQTVYINGRTQVQAEAFPQGNLWELVGECQDCGGFYSNNYPAGCSLIFSTGPGVCGDGVTTKGASFATESAVCGNPPDYVSAMSWRIVGAEILGNGGPYTVDPDGFPHAGFFDN